MHEAWDEFRTATDPLSVWLDQYTISLPTAMVAMAELMAAYNKHLMDTGKTPTTKTAFGLAIKRARPGITDSQRTWKGLPKQRVYLGIGLRSDENDQ